MLIKQKFAGWVGVKINGWCATKETNFEITSISMDKQLIELTDNQISKKHIAEMLKKDIKNQDNFKEKQNMLNFLETIITQENANNISDAKMSRFKKAGEYGER